MSDDRDRTSPVDSPEKIVEILDLIIEASARLKEKLVKPELLSPAVRRGMINSFAELEDLVHLSGSCRAYLERF